MTATTTISRTGARKRRCRARFAMKRSGSVRTTTAGKTVARGEEKQTLWTIKQLRDRRRAKAPLAARQWND